MLYWTTFILFLTVLLSISSPAHRGRGCSAFDDKWMLLTIIWRYHLYLFTASNLSYYWKIYHTKSCVQIILNCDEENMFLMERLFSVVMYWVALLKFRTSVFLTSSVFTGFGKFLEKHIFWICTNDNYRKNLCLLITQKNYWNWNETSFGYKVNLKGTFMCFIGKD